MLYYLFEYLDQSTNLPGTGLFQYISVRSALAFAFSLLISTIYGRKIIDKLRRLQVGESVRDLGPLKNGISNIQQGISNAEGTDR